MQLQQQPNHYSCLITSFAMVLNVPVDVLIGEVGHDGSGEQKGHHLQEMLDLCDRRFKAVTTYECMPMVTELFEASSLWDGPTCYKRFRSLITSYPGVMTGIDPNAHSHAWAWNGFRIFDPARPSDQTPYLDEYQPQYFYVLRSFIPVQALCI